MELICVLALVSVVTLFLSRMLLPASQDYTAIVSADLAKQNLSVLQTEMESRLRYAGSAEITASQRDTRCLYSRNGRLYDGAEELLQAEASGGQWYTVGFETAGAHAVKITLFAWSGNPDDANSEFLYQSSDTVRLLNGTVTSSVSGSDVTVCLAYQGGA